MELPIVHYDPSDTIATNQGNKISRRAKTYGTQNIILNGNSILMKDCLLRGDLAHIRMGKYCIVGESTIIRPPYKYFSKGLTFFPIHFGNYVFIEKNCVLVAVFVGSFVHIGENSIIDQSCVIKDCCYIQPGSVIMPDTVIPPFSIVGGNPAKVLSEWPPTCQKLMEEACTSFYDNYQPFSSAKKQPFIKLEE